MFSRGKHERKKAETNKRHFLTDNQILNDLKWCSGGGVAEEIRFFPLLLFF